MPMTFKLVKTPMFHGLDPARGCAGGSGAQTIGDLFERVESLAALHVGPWPRYRYCYYSACLNVSQVVRRLQRDGFEVAPARPREGPITRGWVFVCTNEGVPSG